MVPLPDNRWVLAGTVSHGIKCAYPDMPGVYMRMTFYKPWIEKVTGLDLWDHKTTLKIIFCEKWFHEFFPFYIFHQPIKYKQWTCTHIEAQIRPIKIDIVVKRPQRPNNSIDFGLSILVLMLVFWAMRKLDNFCHNSNINMLKHSIPSSYFKILKVEWWLSKGKLILVSYWLTIALNKWKPKIISRNMFAEVLAMDQDIQNICFKGEVFSK